MSWRILNAEPAGYDAAARAVLETVGEVVEDDVPAGELAARLGGFDAVIVRLRHHLGERELAAGGGRLKAVVTATTGLDHVDLEAAARHGVEVLSLRGERAFLRSIPATGEHTWALLLALARRLPWAFDGVRRGEWTRDRFRGGELRGRRLGLVGLGRVGEQVAGYGLAFGMEVGAYDPHREGWLTGVARFATLEELLRRSDVLSLHLPLDPSTRGLLGRAELEQLPPGALLVNTSRGGLLDEAAVVELLESGRLAGAALDVVAGERDPARRRESPLLAYARENDNLLLTPHVAGATHESMRRTERFMAEKLRRHLASLAPAEAT